MVFIIWYLHAHTVYTYNIYLPNYTWERSLGSFLKLLYMHVSQILFKNITYGSFIVNATCSIFFASNILYMYYKSLRFFGIFKKGVPWSGDFPLVSFDGQLELSSFCRIVFRGLVVIKLFWCLWINLWLYYYALPLCRHTGMYGEIQMIFFPSQS